MTKREKILTGLCIFQALLVLSAAVFCGLVYIKSTETFVMEGAIGEEQPVLVGIERPTLDTMIVTYKTEDGEAEIRVSCPED